MSMFLYYLENYLLKPKVYTGKNSSWKMQAHILLKNTINIIKQTQKSFRKKLTWEQKNSNLKFLSGQESKIGIRFINSVVLFPSRSRCGWDSYSIHSVRGDLGTYEILADRRLHVYWHATNLLSDEFRHLKCKQQLKKCLESLHESYHGI